MAAKKKFYAVRVGRTIGIFDNWDACKENVTGYPGAEYKGFASLEEARDFLDNKKNKDIQGSKVSVEVEEPIPDFEEKNKTEKNIAEINISEIDNTTYVGENYIQELGIKRISLEEELPINICRDNLVAYVDGSYNHTIKKYSFGCVYVLGDDEIYCDYGNGSNPEALSQRNVSGEMLGAMTATRFAIRNKFKSIEIYYDYKGIEEWVSGGWQAKNELTQKYRDYMRSCMRKINISFVKVAAHTNIKYNELADQTAKYALTH